MLVCRIIRPQPAQRGLSRGWRRKSVRFAFLAILLAAAPIRLQADMIGHGGMVRALAVSPDGRLVLTGSFDYTAKVWDFSDQSELATLGAHNGPVNAVAFLPDGQRALTAGDDRTAILWDLKTYAPVRIFSGHKQKIVSVAVSADGRMAATGSWDRTVRLWDIQSGRQIRVLKQASPVNAVVFAAGGLVIAGGHDGLIRLWDAASGEPRGTMAGHGLGVTALDVSPDGTRLLSASIDRTVRLWDLARRKEIRSYTHHDGEALAVAFSPDGKSALSAGRDGILFYWDLAGAKPPKTIPAHDERIWGVAFSPDGRFALTASSDESVRVWHLATGDRIGYRPEQASSEPKPWLTSDHPGARLFRKCARCHAISSDGPQRSGPNFVGLFGRRVGSLVGYRYSASLKKANFVWNEKTLFELFDKGPDVLLPGTKMPMQRIPNHKQLAELIDYLRELTAAPANPEKSAR